MGLLIKTPMCDPNYCQFIVSLSCFPFWWMGLAPGTFAHSMTISVAFLVSSHHKVFDWPDISYPIVKVVVTLSGNRVMFFD